MYFQYIVYYNVVMKYHIEHDGNVWVASCLDFCLAAQGDSYEEAKEKLEDMIREYVYDATIGEDRDYSSILLTRKAPFISFVRYYLRNAKGN